MKNHSGFIMNKDIKRVVFIKSRVERVVGLISSVLLLFLMTGNSFSKEALITTSDKLQVITSSFDSKELSVGETGSLRVTYKSSGNTKLAGLGLRLHFNSDVLDMGDTSEKLRESALPWQIVDDSSDFDDDIKTDKFFHTIWADTSGDGWPDEAQQPALLYAVPLTAKSGFIGVTQLNFSASSTAADHVLSADSISISSDDTDSDGVLNEPDNCVEISNPDQLDLDADGLGDACDPDIDGDGVLNNTDFYPLISLGGLVDTDEDGIPDDCDNSCIDLGMSADIDNDNDGSIDEFDQFPLDSSEIKDTDGDGAGDNADSDDDNDGIPDNSDVFPLNDYQTLILSSDLSNSYFGIAEYISSGISEPTIRLGVGYSSWNLSASGTYSEHNRTPVIGTWTSVGEGYQLSQLIADPSSFPQFDTTGSYINFNWSGLGIAPGDQLPSGSSQIGITTRFIHRMGVIKKDLATWTLALQSEQHSFAADSKYAIDPSKPIKIDVSDVIQFTILSPELSIVPFSSSELVGTWMIGGINEDNQDSAPHCNLNETCADLVSFSSDGTGKTLRSNRNLSWQVDSNGVLSFTFLDNSATFSVNQIDKKSETLSVHIAGSGNGKYFSSVQLMVKQQDVVPDIGELLLGDTLSSGFYVTNTDYLRSSVDSQLIEFFGFVLNVDGTGSRILTSATAVNALSVVTDLEVYPIDITWTYADGRLISDMCYVTVVLDSGATLCKYLQRRTWEMVSVNNSRMYVLETITREDDLDLDGNAERIAYLSSRPNFYQLASYYDINDVDRDGVVNDEDLFNADSSESADLDGDGVGDNSDPDTDGDGVLNEYDGYPLITLGDLLDTDGDGIPDTCNTSCLSTGMDSDNDDDGDGIKDISDFYPLISLGGLVDTDEDGIPDDCDNSCIDLGMSADIDNDNDGSIDEFDQFPLDSSEIKDTDGDGAGDNADSDDDNDGIPDNSDVFPLNDYQTLILSSDLSNSYFGIAEYISSGISEPTIRLGVGYSSWNLSASGTYSEHNRTPVIGTWTSVGEGYQLSQLIADPSSFPQFDTTGSYINFNWSGLGIAPGDQLPSGSSQIGITTRFIHRMGVIKKDLATWTLALQSEQHSFAADSKYAIDPSKPIKIDVSDVIQFTILSPELSIVPFSSSELVGTWMIGGINEDNQDSAPHCNLNETCADLVSFSSDGTGKTLRSNRNLSWQVDSNGVLSFTFLDNSATFSVNQIDKKSETLSVHIAGSGNGKYFSSVQLMVKQQDVVPDIGELLLGDTLSSGFYVTNTDYLRSSVDSQLIEFFGFVLNVDGTGSRILTSATAVNALSVVTDLEVYPIDITWTYADGRLISDMCYVTVVLDSGATLCKYLQRRTWEMVSVNNSRMYVLETITREDDLDLDGNAERIAYLSSRPNFYQLASYYDINDVDRDGVVNDEDLFNADSSESADFDGDDVGDNGDLDDDNDGYNDIDDAFPYNPDESIDTDQDGLGNNSDSDDDNDGVFDIDDAFPLDPLETLDSDLDGTGDNSDAFPNDPSESVDSDLDGIGDNSDAFPYDARYSADTDLDGMPDAWETLYGLDPNDPSDAISDRDNDGVSAYDEFLAGTIPSGSLDLDGNQKYDALTDGLLFLRGLFGLEGDALTVGLIGSDATYSEPTEIVNRINILGELADVDGNGKVDALTDGLLVLRYLFGLEGDALVKGVVGSDATRVTVEEIETYLETLTPEL